jgi:uncharacterized membrane protein/protein-disulfide isomerase
MIGLNVLALTLTAILSWHYLQGGSMIGCGSGSPCEQVLNSRWSTIGGVLPVSSLAMGLYLALLAAGFFIGPDTDASTQKLAWKALLILAGAIAGSALWFIIVQKWFIGSFCPYCMTAHITGILLITLIIWKAVIHYNRDPSETIDSAKLQNRSATTKTKLVPSRITGLILIGLLISGILAVGQVAITPKSAYSIGQSQDNLTYIDYKTAPIIGSPDAPHVVKLLFDYQCTHCQKLHFMLDEVVRRYSGKLSFVLCPAPLNTQCNPYIPRDVDAFKNSCELARIGLMVWAASHEAFHELENWMFTFESGDKWKPRSLDDVRAKAVELIGKEKMDNTANKNWVESYMQTCVQIYGQTLQNGKGGIPKMVYGSKWVIPQPNNEEDLIKVLQETFDLPAL